MLFRIYHHLVEVSGATEALHLSDRGTRGSHRFSQKLEASTTYRASFFPSTISYWNCLPTRTTDCTT
ncbi:hypothetical protein DPMN_074812 [Dreissena polymorpha]|uniref:Uncharacterized protein n=1 Tax=Dreissena polymorpha TaxID=45954 RepID=A0A9D3YIE3_DREPO|nr:hypothetical protein DPMN_074812 [Dreissena polymorpha]